MFNHLHKHHIKKSVPNTEQQEVAREWVESSRVEVELSVASEKTKKR